MVCVSSGPCGRDVLETVSDGGVVGDAGVVIVDSRPGVIVVLEPVRLEQVGVHNVDPQGR